MLFYVMLENVWNIFPHPVVQSFSHVQLFVTLWTTALQASLFLTISQSLFISCALSWWCHPTISSFVIPFSSCLPSFRVFSMSWLFASGGQIFEASASASVLPVNIQDWFPLGLTALISFQSKQFSSLLQHHSLKASLWCSAFFMVQLSHPDMMTGKSHSFD